MPVRDPFEVNSYYFVKNRSKNHKVLWRNSSDFEKFLKTIVSYLIEFEQIAILAYVVLPDQYQFLIKNGEHSHALSRFLRRIQISYAMYYKKKYPAVLAKWEAVFPDRFIAEKIWSELALKKIAESINLAPVRNWIVKKISDRPYTSAHQVMKTGYTLKNWSKWETHIRVVA